MGQPLLLVRFTASEIILAHEFRERILLPGESINTPQCNRVRLTDIIEDPIRALVYLENLDGAILSGNLMGEGSTQTAGTGDRVHAFRIVPGYTFGARWADLATLYSELILRNGAAPEFNGEPVADWTTQLQWEDNGRLRSITLTASATAPFPRCE